MDPAQTLLSNAHRRTVAVGFDASPASRTALAYAASWAHRDHARLAVVYVEPTCGMGLIDAIAAALRVPGAPLRDMPAEAARTLSETAAGAPADWSYLAARGSAAEQLDDAANALLLT